MKKLREENKSTEEFEIMLNCLSLEEIIGLKLEGHLDPNYSKSMLSVNVRRYNEKHSLVAPKLAVGQSL